METRMKRARSNQRMFHDLCHWRRVRVSTAKKSTQKRRVGERLRERGERVSGRSRTAGSAMG